jgi:ABC transporter substrate binding protein (PQQ-dependent alcohol dehydrogenase system)
MYFDALSQYLVYNGWRKVLLVHGTSEEDVKRKTELATSIKRFGATVEEERAFTLSHHPDDRDRNKPEFLTGQASYDVVAVVDSVKDYGRKIEFNTRRPRPVVGDVGLVPRAWHFALERYGAPQLNDRYRDLAPKLPDFRAAMTDNEFAAWASVKLVSNSLNEIHMTEDGIDLNRLFLDPDARVDLYKGTRGSFRDWNHQMRHPILLTTQNYVAGIAPMPKFLHPKYYVDTLGKDRPESSCQLSQ